MIMAGGGECFMMIAWTTNKYALFFIMMVCTINDDCLMRRSLPQQTPWIFEKRWNTRCGLSMIKHSSGCMTFCGSLHNAHCHNPTVMNEHPKHDQSIQLLGCELRPMAWDGCGLASWAPPFKHQCFTGDGRPGPVGNSPWLAFNWPPNKAGLLTAGSPIDQPSLTIVTTGRRHLFQ